MARAAGRIEVCKGTAFLLSFRCLVWGVQGHCLPAVLPPSFVCLRQCLSFAVSRAGDDGGRGHQAEAHLRKGQGVLTSSARRF